jgi:phage anti-repressor protein
MNEIIPINHGTIGGEEVNTVDARELHERLGSKQQFADWIRAKVVDNPFFLENQDYVLLHEILKQIGRGGHNRKDYALTIDTAKKVAMAEQTESGDKVRDYFLDCERRAKAAAPAISYPEALRRLANEVEQRELAIAQRDEAVRTKALIGNKREATAMATASTATRRADALADEVGRGKTYLATRSIPWLDEYFVESKGMFSVLGKKLSLLGLEMGLPPRDIPNSDYGSVKIHHRDVIEKLRRRLAADDEMMLSYRR